MMQRIMSSNRYKALLYLVGTAILWSTGGLLIKSVEWHPLAIAGIRSIIAAAVIGWFFRHSPISWSKDQLIGALAYAGTVVFFVTATKLTTAANAILLQFTAPVYVALLSGWLLKERTSIWDWITICIVFCGMGLFFVDKVSPGGVWGNICAIAAGVCFGLFAIFMRKQKDGSPFGSVLIGNLLTFIIGLPFMFGSVPSLNGWFALLCLGIFQLGLSYVLYSHAIKEVTALEAIMIPVIEPILNPLWVFFFLGEKPGFWALAGGAVIVVAVTARYAIAEVFAQRGKVITDRINLHAGRVK